MAVCATTGKLNFQRFLKPYKKPTKSFEMESSRMFSQSENSQLLLSSFEVQFFNPEYYKILKITEGSNERQLTRTSRRHVKNKKMLVGRL